MVDAGSDDRRNKTDETDRYAKDIDYDIQHVHRIAHDLLSLYPKTDMSLYFNKMKNPS